MKKWNYLYLARRDCLCNFNLPFYFQEACPIQNSTCNTPLSDQKCRERSRLSSLKCAYYYSIFLYRETTIKDNQFSKRKLLTSDAFLNR